MNFDQNDDEIRIQIDGDITRKLRENQRFVVKKIEQIFKLKKPSRRRQLHQNQCQKLKNRLHVFTSLTLGGLVAGLTSSRTFSSKLNSSN